MVLVGTAIIATAIGVTLLAYGMVKLMEALSE